MTEPNIVSEQVTPEMAAAASDALDYLTDMARGHDYADNAKINAAADALADVLDAHGYRLQAQGAEAREVVERTCAYYQGCDAPADGPCGDYCQTHCLCGALPGRSDPMPIFRGGGDRG